MENPPPDPVAADLVEYALGLKVGDLSDGAVHAAKRSVIDSMGCAFGAFDESPMRDLRRLAGETSATRPATVLGSSIRTSPDLAALVNGGMIRYLDFSDDYFGGDGSLGPHPSDNIGGVLAAAESESLDGPTFLMAVVLAYEIVGQIVDNIVVTTPRSWDYPTLHAAATCLAAGRLWGLTADQMVSALGMAVVPNICLGQTRHGSLSDWKGLAGPNGSRNGLFAAMLAAKGISGPDEPISGPAGLRAHLGVGLELGDFGGGSTPFRIERTFFKWLPVRYHCQLPVWTALDLRERIGASGVPDIERIQVFLAQRYVTDRMLSPADWNPTTSGTADHSFAYLVAAALVDGAITRHTFTPARYRDPEILALAQRIELRVDEEFTASFPSTFNTRFEVDLSSGPRIQLHGTNPKGHPSNPLSDADIDEKYLRQTDAVMPAERAEELLTTLWNLEDVSDVGKIMSLAVASPELERSDR